MDYSKEKQKQRKREYYREWRKNHPEAVQAAQLKYWTKKATEARSQVQTADPVQGKDDNDGSEI